MSQPLEQAFTDQLRRNLEAADALGILQKRLAADVERWGGVSCARELLRKNRLSEGFDALAAAGKLELSLEALVVAGKYAALFTDEEVNRCFAALCDGGFYTWSR